MYMKSIKQFIVENEYKLYSVDEAHRLLNKYFNSLDFRVIPLSLRKKSIKDYQEIFNDTKLASEESLLQLKDNIYESLKTDIESTQKAIQTLKDKYKMLDCQFKAIHPYDVQIVSVDKIPNYIATTNSVLLPLVRKNVEIIIKEMDEIGYYKVREESRYDKETNCEWVLLMFDPKVQEDISTQIRKRCSRLYHISPFYNYESIKEKGLIPSNNGRVYKFNKDRVYLLTVDLNHFDFKKMLINTAADRKRRDKSFDGKFVIYEIKTSKLPNDIKFYLDPHGRNCIYTNTLIPYTAIIDEEEKQV